MSRSAGTVYIAFQGDDSPIRQTWRTLLEELKRGVTVPIHAQMQPHTGTASAAGTSPAAARGAPTQESFRLNVDTRGFHDEIRTARQALDSLRRDSERPIVLGATSQYGARPMPFRGPPQPLSYSLSPDPTEAAARISTSRRQKLQADLELMQHVKADQRGSPEIDQEISRIQSILQADAAARTAPEQRRIEREGAKQARLEERLDDAYERRMVLDEQRKQRQAERDSRRAATMQEREAKEVRAVSRLEEKIPEADRPYMQRQVETRMGRGETRGEATREVTRQYREDTAAMTREVRASEQLSQAKIRQAQIVERQTRQLESAEFQTRLQGAKPAEQAAMLRNRIAGIERQGGTLTHQQQVERLELNQQLQQTRRRTGFGTDLGIPMGVYFQAMFGAMEIGGAVTAMNRAERLARRRPGDMAAQLDAYEQAADRIGSGMFGGPVRAIMQTAAPIYDPEASALQQGIGYGTLATAGVGVGGMAYRTARRTMPKIGRTGAGTIGAVTGVATAAVFAYLAYHEAETQRIVEEARETLAQEEAIDALRETTLGSKRKSELMRAGPRRPLVEAQFEHQDRMRKIAITARPGIGSDQAQIRVSAMYAQMEAQASEQERYSLAITGAQADIERQSHAERVAQRQREYQVRMDALAERSIQAQTQAAQLRSRGQLTQAQLLETRFAQYADVERAPEYLQPVLQARNEALQQQLEADQQRNLQQIQRRTQSLQIGLTTIDSARPFEQRVEATRLLRRRDLEEEHGVEFDERGRPTFRDMRATTGEGQMLEHFERLREFNAALERVNAEIDENAQQWRRQTDLSRESLEAQVDVNRMLARGTPMASMAESIFRRGALQYAELPESPDFDVHRKLVEQNTRFELEAFKREYLGSFEAVEIDSIRRTALAPGSGVGAGENPTAVLNEISRKLDKLEKLDEVDLVRVGP